MRIKLTLNGIKSVILWAFIKKNRDKVIENTKNVLSALKIAAKLTKTKKDDEAVLFLEKKVKTIKRLNERKN